MKYLDKFLTYLEEPLKYLSNLKDTSFYVDVCYLKKTHLKYLLKYLFLPGIYGSKTAIVSDHKPLESIMKKPLSRAPARLQRMMLRLQKYDFELTYCPGSKMILADTLSRAYLKQVGTEIDKDDLDAQVHLVSSMVETSGVDLARMKKITSEDEILSELTQNILHGWPIKKTQLNDRVKQYWSYRDELSIINGMIFKGERVIVHTEMQSEMLRNLHISHMGIEKTKLRANIIVIFV